MSSSSQLTLLASMTDALTVTVHGPAYGVSTVPVGTPVLDASGKRRSQVGADRPDCVVATGVVSVSAEAVSVGVVPVSAEASSAPTATESTSASAVSAAVATLLVLVGENQPPIASARAVTARQMRGRDRSVGHDLPTTIRLPVGFRADHVRRPLFEAGGSSHRLRGTLAVRSPRGETQAADCGAGLRSANRARSTAVTAR
jgi:hypothetical protein